MVCHFLDITDPQGVECGDGGLRGKVLAITDKIHPFCLMRWLCQEGEDSGIGNEFAYFFQGFQEGAFTLDLLCFTLASGLGGQGGRSKGEVG